MKALPLLLAPAACMTAPESPSGACNAEAGAALIGRMATTELGGEALRLTGARRLRWIRPGDMVTMDYSAGRLNLSLDGQGRVARLSCG